MLEKFLDSIYISVISRRPFQLFAVFNRLLLGIAFIPPSITKIINQPFTILPESDPVGAYFFALYNTGYYYQFLGWAQLTAAILLLIPRTAHIGAFMFFPIILNIAVLTNSVGFKGTWLITIMMSLAALYLVAWEYDRIKPFIFNNRKFRSNGYSYQMIWLPAFFGLGGFTLGILVQLAASGNLSNNLRFSVILAVIGLVFGFLMAIHFRFMRVGSLTISRDETRVQDELLKP